MKRTATLAGLSAAIALGVGLALAGQPSAVCWTAGVTLLCAVWWISEALPMAVTALVPFAIFPLVGVLTPAQVGQAYGSPLILLYLGGFMLSTAMAKSGAHRRLALAMVNAFGAAGDRGVVFGFMAAAALLSMWISNTATSLMLLPIALATLENVADRRLKIGLLLGIAYACNVGGIGTPIGTPPNLILMQVYSDTTGTQLSFLEWMTWGLPVVVIFVPLIGLWVTRGVSRTRTITLPQVGAWRTEEKRTLAVFALTALAWMTRSDPFGGWSAWLDLPQANDASVALLAVVLMFLLPSGNGGRLLDWETVIKIPWGHPDSFRGGHLHRQCFRQFRHQPDRRRGAGSVERTASAAGTGGHLPVRHLSHRNHQQYRHDRAADADPGSGGHRRRPRPAVVDGSGGHERQLRLHAARGHGAQRGDLRLGPRAHSGHGSRGHGTQFLGRRGSDRRLFHPVVTPPVLAAGLLPRAAGAIP